MSGPQPIGPELAGILQYLREIGYGELYARPRSASPAPVGTARPDASSPAPAAAPPAAGPASGARAGAAAGAAARTSEAPPAPERGLAPPPSPPGSLAEPVAVPADPAERAAELAALAARAAACVRCRLATGRNRVVFGAGDPAADLMLIGEGPGAEEDRQGLPFVGPAGDLLNRIIQAIGLARAQVYIANIVKCRPPGNRDPQPDEVAACRGYLERQIDLVQPRVIVALGRVAAQTLLGNDAPIGRLRGRWYTVQGVPTRVTYHPAALLRSPDLKRPTWEDMQQVRDRLQPQVDR